MEKDSTLHLYFVIIAIVLSIIVAFVSLMPGSGVPKVAFKHLDKLVHFALYFLLSISYGLVFCQMFKATNFKKWLYPFLMALCFSILMEFCQEIFTNTRYFDVFDILANGIGSFFGILILKKLSLTFKTINLCL